MMDSDEARAFEARMARQVAGPEIARLEAALTAERERAERAERERDACKLEAQAHAQERRTQASIVRGVYQLVTGATGEPGDWHGVEPVRDLVAERDTLRERVAVLQAECAAGRMQRRLNTTHTRDLLRQAERATDAAGAMEVDRG